MPVGDKFAFLQLSDSSSTVVSTVPVTLTVALTALPNQAANIRNNGTTAVWIGIGTRSTSSAAITTKGLYLPERTVYGSERVVRTGGQLTIAACCVGATQTTTIIVAGGEGVW